MSDRITISYQVSDGYVGPSHPQYFEVDPEDFIGMDAAQVERALDQMAVEDMLQKVSADIRNIDEMVNTVLTAAERAEAEE